MIYIKFSVNSISSHMLRSILTKSNSLNPLRMRKKNSIKCQDKIVFLGKLWDNKDIILSTTNTHKSKTEKKVPTPHLLMLYNIQSVSNWW